MGSVLRLSNDSELKIILCDKVIVKREYDSCKGILIKELILVRIKDGVEYHDTIPVDKNGNLIYESYKYTGWSTEVVEQPVDLKLFKEEQEDYGYDHMYDDTDVDFYEDGRYQ